MMESSSKPNVSILNPHQRSHLLTGLQHVDRLLADIEQILAAGETDCAFPRYVPDVGGRERELLTSTIPTIRRYLIPALERQGIPRPQPRISSTHAVRTNLEYAEMAVEELRPRHMKGYGAVPEAAAPQLERMVD